MTAVLSTLTPQYITHCLPVTQLLEKLFKES